MSYGTACITRSSNPRNQLLQHLAYGDMERLRPMLRRVTLVAGQILYERGDPLRNVFFIEEGIVTLLAKAKNGDVVEVDLTGREGVIGAPVLLRSEAVALHRTIVQGPGSAWMIGSGAFLAAADDLPRLRNWCLRYLYSTHAEAVQPRRAMRCIQ